MQETDCDVVGCAFFKTKRTYDEQFQLVSSCKTEIFNDPLSAFMKKRRVATTVWGRLYKREFIRTPFIEDIYFEDVPWTFEIFSRLKRYALISAPLYGYYTKNVSTMRSVWTNEKTDSYIRVIRSCTLFTAKNIPGKMAAVRRYILNGRVKMIMSRIKNSPDRISLYNYAAPKIRRLYQEGLISYHGLKWRHKIDLYRLLHDVSELENGKYTRISQTVYPLWIDDLLRLPDALPRVFSEEKDIVLLIGNKSKNIPDRLYSGRPLLEKLKANGETTAPVHIAFFRNRPWYDLLSPFCRAYRNRFHAFGTEIYHIDPKKIRSMKLERNQRTKDNAYLYSKWPLSEKQRKKQYEELKNSLLAAGFDDNHPIEIMLCRSFGVKDTVYQGHHRIMFCIDMEIPVVGIVFMYVSHCPRFLIGFMSFLSSIFSKNKE